MSKIELHMVLPDWMIIDGVIFSRAQFTRRTPHPLWLPRRRNAWRGMRIRAVVLEHSIEAGEIDPIVCWAECRLYLEGDGMGALSCALSCARHLTLCAQENKMSAKACALHSQAIIQFDRRLQAA